MAPAQPAVHRAGGLRHRQHLRQVPRARRRHAAGAPGVPRSSTATTTTASRPGATKARLRLLTMLLDEFFEALDANTSEHRQDRLLVRHHSLTDDERAGASRPFFSIARTTHNHHKERPMANVTFSSPRLPKDVTVHARRRRHPDAACRRPGAQDPGALRGARTASAARCASSRSTCCRASSRSAWR
ncbi:MAG: hypothetical protein MZW92_59725 [Comamonadaceae bacterium]|nr:hypothetical protein [Comamonadaceae bacterium]